MGYEIIGESIKSALSIKLGEIFKVATNQTDQQGNVVYTYPTRYKEKVINLKYPHFFIYQVQVTPTPRGRDRIELDYLINIRYRYAEEPSTITNIEQILDNVGLKLCTELLSINLELPVKVENRRYEKSDGVLQFFCDIRIFVKPEEPEEVKMQELELNEEEI